jgi:hypothetical protein
MRKFKVKVNGKEYEVEIEEIKTEETAEKKEDKKEEEPKEVSNG